jgi:hypothetical protein
MNTAKVKSIRTQPVTVCPFCGSSNGHLIHEGLKDFTYGAPGEWNFRRCNNADCGMVWLDPMPLAEDLGVAYQGYYTHEQPEPGASFFRDFIWGIWMAYLVKRFGYPSALAKSWQRLLSPLALLHPGDGQNWRRRRCTCQHPKKRRG